MPMYQVLFEHASEGILVIRASDDVILDANPTGCRMLGIAPEHLLGRCVDDLAGDQGRPKVQAIRAQVLSEGRYVGKLESPFQRPDGSQAVIRVTSAVLVRMAEPWIIAFFEDAGEAREAIRRLRDSEEALRESRGELQAIYDSMAEGIFITDPETTRLLRVNPAGCRMLGYSEQELLRLTVADLHPAEWREHQLSRFAARLKGDTSMSPDVPCLRKDGTLVYVEISASLVIRQGRCAVAAIFRDVTDRRQAELQLQESEARYGAVAEATRDPIFTFDRTGRFVAANQSAVRYMGDPPGGLVGKAMHEVFPRPIADRQWASVKRVFDTGEPLHSEENQSRTAAGPRWFNTSLTPIRGSDGTVQHVVGIARDVTERKEAEAALRESEEKYRALVEATDTGFDILDGAGRVLDANAEYVRLTGHTTLQQIVGRKVTEWTAPHDLARNAEEVRLCAERGWVRNLVIDYVNPAGGFTPIEVNATVLRAADGVRIVALCRDITDRKRAEEALQHSEEKYRDLFDRSVDGISIVTDKGIVLCNEAFARIHGRPAAELLGKHVADLLVPEDAPRARERVARLLAGQPVVGVGQYRVPRPGGTVAWMETHSTCIAWEGKPAFQTVACDITERKAAEEALRESEEKYRTLFEQNADGVVVLVEGTIVRANEAYARIHGCTPDEIIGRPLLDIVPPHDRDQTRQRIEAVLRGETLVPFERRTSFIRLDGTQAIVEVRSKRISWEGRAAVQGIVRDITEQVRLEEQLLHAQKMEAIGRLAGGIAHDFNNLMTGILCHAGLLKAAARRGDAVFEGADVIEGAARRAAELTRQLLGYARRGKHQHATVDMHETIGSVTRLVGGTLDPRIRLRQELHADPPTILGDPAQMEQVVMNLTMNARDAMPDGGQMLLATDLVDFREAAPCLQSVVPPGRYFSLAVSDTGRGIPADLKEHIFEPFFTTKPRGQGTGMGLAMVYGIVKNHGGYVDLESEVGHGCTFTIYLPSAPAERAASAAGVPGAAEAVVRGTGRILVVDDDAVVRDVTRRTLAGLGYEVDTAAGGQEAVAFYAAHPGRIGLVIIDMQMGPMDGRACFRALRQVDPGVRAILSTGYGFDGVAQQMMAEGMVGFVQKPFEVPRLSQAVADALAPGR